MREKSTAAASGSASGASPEWPERLRIRVCGRRRLEAPQAPTWRTRTWGMLESPTRYVPEAAKRKRQLPVQPLRLSVARLPRMRCSRLRRSPPPPPHAGMPVRRAHRHARVLRPDPGRYRRSLRSFGAVGFIGVSCAKPCGLAPECRRSGATAARRIMPDIMRPFAGSALIVRRQAQRTARFRLTRAAFRRGPHWNRRRSVPLAQPAPSTRHCAGARLRLSALRRHAPRELRRS